MYSSRNFILFVLLSVFCVSAKAEDDSWKVLIPGLPERVFASDESNSTSFYVLTQTHEPVFRWKDGENYSSKLLKKWSRSLDYRHFEFCLDTSLEFSSGDKFGADQFAVQVSSFTSGYSSKFSLTKYGTCVRVSFDVPKKDYLYFWTLYAHAPTKRVSENMELGLGPFYVDTISKNRILLRRRKNVRGGYNAIELLDYRGGGDPNLNNHEIKDFNLIPPRDIPEWVKKSFFSYKNPEMRSLVLLINHPDEKVRAGVYNCIDIKALREAYFPGKMDYFDIASILPMGVPGAAAGFPQQNCGKPRIFGRRLRFANWMDGNQETMRKFAEMFQAKSGLALVLDRYGMDDFALAIERRPRPFELAMIMVYVSSSPKESFRMFFNKGELYDFEVPRLSSRYRELSDDVETSALDETYRKLALEISRHALALPISQGMRTLYYPKEIKNFYVGSGIAEYPEVAEFRR